MANSSVCTFNDTTFLVMDSLSANYYDGPYHVDRFFGWENGIIDDGSVPDINGLIYRTSIGKHLAVRCPDNKVILNWVSQRIKLFADWCHYGPSDTIPSIYSVYTKASSAEDICNHYLSLIGDPDNINSQPSDTAIFREQFAKLLVDVFYSNEYCTFQEVTWHDCGDCDDSSTYAWHTINTKNGHQLELSDLISKEDKTNFAIRMISHLCNNDGPWFDYNMELKVSDVVDVLEQRSGFALLSDGVIVYYYPYVLGNGEDGQYNALIPYEEIMDIINIRLE